MRFEDMIPPGLRTLDHLSNLTGRTLDEAWRSSRPAIISVPSVLTISKVCRRQ